MAAYGSAEPRRVRTKSGSLAWILLIVVLVCTIPCIGLLIGLMLPAVQAAREAGRRTQCINKLHQLGLAMTNYHVTFKHFPPAATLDPNGDNPVSWRIQLLPFIDSSLYKTYNKSKPWNDPANQAVLKSMPLDFKCPSDQVDGPNETSYFMVTGRGTVGGLPGSQGIPLSKIRNGPSRTILIVDVPGMHVPWTQPKDITLTELIAHLKEHTLSAHPAGFNVTFCDGSAQVQPIGDLDVDTLEKMATTGERQAADRQPFSKRRLGRPPLPNNPAPDAGNPLEAK
jgi:prepilin-type processing-associated H-X9-DG protein